MRFFAALIFLISITRSPVTAHHEPEITVEELAENLAANINNTDRNDGKKEIVMEEISSSGNNNFDNGTKEYIGDIGLQNSGHVPDLTQINRTKMKILNPDEQSDILGYLFPDYSDEILKRGSFEPYFISKYIAEKKISVTNLDNIEKRRQNNTLSQSIMRNMSTEIFRLSNCQNKAENKNFKREINNLDPGNPTIGEIDELMSNSEASNIFRTKTKDFARKLREEQKNIKKNEEKARHYFIGMKKREKKYSKHDKIRNRQISKVTKRTSKIFNRNNSNISPNLRVNTPSSELELIRRQRQILKPTYLPHLRPQIYSGLSEQDAKSSWRPNIEQTTTETIETISRNKDESKLIKVSGKGQNISLYTRSNAEVYFNDDLLPSRRKRSVKNIFEISNKHSPTAQVSPTELKNIFLISSPKTYYTSLLTDTETLTAEELENHKFLIRPRKKKTYLSEKQTTELPVTTPMTAKTTLENSLVLMVNDFIPNNSMDTEYKQIYFIVHDD